MAMDVPVTKARAELADLVNRVVYGGERVVLTRHGKPVAAIVSAAELELLQSRDRGDAELHVLSSDASAVRADVGPASPLRPAAEWNEGRDPVR